MIAGLKAYAEYKESPLPWLGQVPRHWQVRRMKSAIMNIIEQTYKPQPLRTLEEISADILAIEKEAGGCSMAGWWGK